MCFGLGWAVVYSKSLMNYETQSGLGRALALGLALGFLGAMPGCHLGPGAIDVPGPVGREVLLPDGLGFTMPNAYHESTSRLGRTYRVRGAATPSYSTIVVQSRAAGYPVALDEAAALTLARLEQLDNFDLIDEQLLFVGDDLALVYAADFDLLDVRRRQWGVLIATPQGLTAVMMTSPLEAFAAASDDYLTVLHSLHKVDVTPPPGLH